MATHVKCVPYRWPDLSRVCRRYLVVDNHGRYGIALSSDKDSITAYPIETDRPPRATGVVSTSTVWHLQDGGLYRGAWYDDDDPANPPPGGGRVLTVVDDLGIVMPDQWADTALAGSDAAGHWDHGATLGKVGGEAAARKQNQNPDEVTVQQAEEYAREVGETITRRGIRKAAKNGHIPGARKAGRDWLISFRGFKHYLDNRPRRGPKPQVL